MEFILAEQAGRKAVFSELAKQFTVRPGKRRRAERTLFDTFDWRLYAAGQRVEEVREAGSLSARWLESATGRVLGATNGEVERLARDWRPQPLAQALARIIKMRALLPLVKLETEWWPADLLDERKKIAARVTVEICKAGKIGAKADRAVPAVVRLSAVRGHRAAFKQAADILAAMPGLARGEAGLPDGILSVNGRIPLGYTSKIDAELVFGQPAEEAVRQVLQRLVDIMAANHDGAVADIDTEFLHDFRVAVRRTRSMLGQMKAAVPSPLLRTFRPEFDWLGKVTGPTRDLDVYLLKFDEYTAPLGDMVRRNLEPLRKHILRRQRQEQLSLARALTAGRYHRLIDKWRETLSSPWRSGAAGFRGGDPAEAVAARRILKIFKRALRQGGALTDDSPAPAVHALRITCKKLRYMLEFFKNLFRADKIDRLTAELKQLQDALGDFQDYEMHRTQLYAFAEEMTGRKTVSPQTLLAMGCLAESLTARQRTARQKLDRRFARFAAKENAARFRKLFTPAGNEP